MPQSEFSVRTAFIPSPLSNGYMARVVWHKLQYYLNKDPGTVRMWLNDSLIVDESSFTWAAPAGAWQSIQLGATWGGGIGYPGPAGNLIYYDRCAIWSR